MLSWRAISDGAKFCEMDDQVAGRVAQLELRLSVHGLGLADAPADEVELLLLPKELGYGTAIARAMVRQALRLDGLP